MRLDWGKLVIGCYAALLVGCAQVGQISGGEEDKTAPVPIESLSSPVSGTINFTGNEVRLTFDEFIQLNSPQQTISIVPKHANLNARINKKTVIINWADTLKPNTTYVISLNRTIKDISEGNDSLLQVVFSTGSTVDSISYKGKLVNSFTTKPEKDITVGLFSMDDSLLPIYFAKSQADGSFTFNYLKSGLYNVFAFDDKNGDGQRQGFERSAFRNDPLQLDSSLVDTIPLRVFVAPLPPSLKNYKFQAPGSILIGSTVPLTDVSFFVNETAINSSEISLIRKDSVQLFCPASTANELQLVAVGKDWADTISVRVSEKDKSAALKIKGLNSKMGVGPHERASFQVTDIITRVDTSNIKCFDGATKTTVPYTVNFSRDTLYFDFNRSSKKSIRWVFQTGAVQGKSGTSNDTISFNMPIRLDREYGSLLLKTKGFPLSTRFELLRENKVIRSVSSPLGGEFTLEFLEPGEYSLRALDDLNNNEMWDTGNVSKHIQPEEVRYFTNPIRIRANWDVEVELVAKP